MEKKIKESKLLLAFFSVSGGTVVAQLLNFAFQPIVTRVYSVTQFGEYSIYVSILSIASVAITLAYDQAVIAAKNQDEAQNLLFGTMYISVVLSAIIAIFCTIFYSKILEWLKLKTCDWLFLLPINLIILSFYNLTESYNYRLKAYKSIGVVASVRSLIMGVLQVLLFYLELGVLGMIVGRICAIFICGIILFFNIKKSGLLVKNSRIKAVLLTLKANYQFPCYQLPASFVNHFLDSIITFIILSLYSKNDLGIYALVVQILSMPISLISSSMRQLCISEFSKLTDKKTDAKKLFLKICIGLLILISIPMTFLFLFGENIFTYVFGVKWIGIGPYIKALSFLYVVKFMAYPLSSIATVTKKQVIILGFQFLLIFSAFGAYGIAKLLSLSIIQYLEIQSLLMSIIYVTQTVVYYQVLNRKSIKS